jgi:hypothetical protein
MDLTARDVSKRIEPAFPEVIISISEGGRNRSIPVDREIDR